MGVIIRMDSKEFLKSFVPKVDNINEYSIVLISKNIKSRGKFKNVKPQKGLVPPESVLRAYVEGDKKEYKQSYLSFLQQPKNMFPLLIFAKLAVVDNYKIIFLCSKSENEYKYLKLICDFIETVFKFKTFSLKSYLKDPQKAEKIKNRDEVSKILSKKADKYNKLGLNISTDPIEEDKKNKDLDKKKDKLKKQSKKDLKKKAKKKGIDIDSGESKKDIIKKILDNL